MFKMALEDVNRIEDYENLLELLAPPKEITKILPQGDCKGIKIGIIGGGVAGLASAFELRKLGFDITIFEMEKKRIGGRIYTHYFDKSKKNYGELGAMRIPVGHETTWHYINTFNLKSEPFIQNDENTFIYIKNKRARNDSEGISVMEKIYPLFNLTREEKNKKWQELIGDSLGKNLFKISPYMRRELLQIKKNYSPTIEYWGSLGIRKAFERSGLSDGAIELISGVAPFLGAFYYNSYIENVIEEYTVDYAYRYRLSGGMVNLPLAFYNSLMSKNPKEYVDIQSENLGNIIFKNGTRVEGIYKRGKNNKVRIKYKDERTSKILNKNFDFIVCTIPFSSLRNVDVDPAFSSKKMQAIKEVNYTSSQKTAFMCSNKFWEKGNANERILGGGSATDLPIQTIWYPDNLNKIQEEKGQFKAKNNNGVFLSSYNLAQDAIRLGNLDDRVRINEIKSQVEHVHGLPKGYLNEIVKDYKTIDWNREKGFNGAFCYFMPDQQRNFLYAMAQTEYDNRVYFAGEHISSIHGWIEGAVNTGMKAANGIAEYCKNL